MFRKIIPALLFVFASSFAFSQSALMDKKIAPFQIKLANGQQYTSAQLAAGPVVLIYFSPDCEHCQDFTKDMLKNYNVIANKQVVMITFQSMEMLKPFVSQHKLSTYPNIKVGTEGYSYTVQRYYQIKSFPYIAIYNKAGKLVQTFEGEQPHQNIFNVLKKI
ncbi:TlpA family protein disulfide reductase [Dyadobacter fanqingshengii]|uniref:Redoxin domain-containing protein n=1 Tax=Dyadobacter fanqingshengii TaxID=2906443 RepID=A0A9X1TAH4_9BACT|nr:thioredoxin fold domain-containing protein [Dyadobacter fanqingshengii]MCF0040939.1 redoxin domain-containing protein [Dyadobacter fanqingshengii]USJ37329.1 thioredoxin-like domain-containing protein [Dyadobacter fanqingshengii]